MTRRDANWVILQATAVTGAPEFFASWLSAGLRAAGSRAAHQGHSTNSPAPPDPHDWNSYTPKFFSLEDFRALEAFASILIPTDDTPGAREAHVPAFIDFVVNAAAEYAPEVQEQWRDAMRWLHSQQFIQLKQEEQISLVRRISEPERGRSKTGDAFAVYRLLKSMTVHAFYTSRIGLTDVLEYKGNAYLIEFPACTHPEHHSA